VHLNQVGGIRTRPERSDGPRASTPWRREAAP